MQSYLCLPYEAGCTRFRRHRISVSRLPHGLTVIGQVAAYTLLYEYLGRYKGLLKIFMTATDSLGRGPRRGQPPYHTFLTRQNEALLDISSVLVLGFHPSNCGHRWRWLQMRKRLRRLIYAVLTLCRPLKVSAGPRTRTGRR